MDGSIEISYLSALFLKNEESCGTSDNNKGLPYSSVLKLITNFTKIATVEIRATEISVETDFTASRTLKIMYNETSTPVSEAIESTESEAAISVHLDKINKSEIVANTASTMIATFIPTVLAQEIDLKNIQYSTTMAFPTTRNIQMHVAPTMTAMPQEVFYKPCHQKQENSENVDSAKDGKPHFLLTSYTEFLPSIQPDKIFYNEEHLKEKKRNSDIYCRHCEGSPMNAFFLSGSTCLPYVSQKHFNHEGLVFTCTRCSFMFTGMLDLKLHIHLRHPGLHLCCYCECASMNKYDLKSHKDEEHECVNKKIVNEYLQGAIYMTHMKLHFQTFCCFICASSHTNEQNLKKHLFDKHKVVLSYGCGFCDYTCFEVLELTGHLFIHQEVEQLLEKHNNKPELVEMPSFDQTYQCSACDFTCGTEEILQMHKYIHNIYCVHCNYICEGKSLMSDHKCRTNKNKEKKLEDTKFQCDDCLFVCNDKELMMKHVKENMALEDGENSPKRKKLN